MTQVELKLLNEANRFRDLAKDAALKAITCPADEAHHRAMVEQHLIRVEVFKTAATMARSTR